MRFEWRMPTRIIFGPGSLQSLPTVLHELGARRVLLALGCGAMTRSGGRDRTLSLLSGFEVCVHEGIRVNLPMEDCNALILSARRHRAEAVVGLGGGSVLDGAKAAAFLAPKGGTVEDHLSDAAGGRSADLSMPAGLAFVAIPTTAGTGSEVTPSAILLDSFKKRKVSLSAKEAMARVAIVDPKLTLSLPPEQTAATGLDALSHGFEAYWSKAATPLSDLLALSAISGVLGSLRSAYLDPLDLSARTEMSLSATTAGMALAHTATAAVHGITYPLTAHHGVPHGLACAFLLGEVFSVNFYHLLPEKQSNLLRHLKSNTLAAALDLLAELCHDLKVPETLADIGIANHEIQRLAEEAAPANLERNIAPLSREKILELWAKKKRK